MLTTTLIFDPKTLANWKAEGISEVTIGFAQKGCEGTELAVVAGKPGEVQNHETHRSVSEMVISESQSGIFEAEARNSKIPFEPRTIPETDIIIHALPEDWEKLENSRITYLMGKWIFTSDKVKRRCGCGTSFSFSDEDKLSRNFPKPAFAKGMTWFSLLSRSAREITEITEECHMIVDLGGAGGSEKEATEIRIPAGASVIYRGLFPTGSRIKIRFVLEDRTKLDARFLTLASGGHVHADIEATIKGSGTQADIEYRAFAFEDAEIQADTHIDIRENLEDATWNIVGKNIFFADRARVSGTPRVSAASDKIRAGHSLSFEKLSEIDEFFLQSRGISERKSRRMLAEAHIHRIFSDFPPGFEEVAQYLANAAASGLE